MMKKILITGVNSYIGRNLKAWLEKEPNKYCVDLVSVKDDAWKRKAFKEFDVLFHVAGIVHIKETKKNRDLFYKVNRDLTYEIAKKAKVEGVKQFIFMSSMSVYGIENGVINEKTALNPKSNYGKSKLEAEMLIRSLEDEAFKIAILRPPMIYGKGCRGNYSRLAKLAVKVPIFPDVDNKRSMIYIENFCEFVRFLIDNCSSGVFFPQNTEYVKTSELVAMIAEAHGKRIKLTKLFDPFLRLFNVSIISKMFGDLVYDKQMSFKFIELDINRNGYRVVSFKESIKRTEK